MPDEEYGDLSEGPDEKVIRFTSEDIYLSEDNRYIYFGNSRVELKFSKRSGFWIDMLDKVTGIHVLGRDNEILTVQIVVGAVQNY